MPAAPDYSRQMRLTGIGPAGQRRLRTARVLVLGAGGLGSAALPILAGAGVGALTVVDPDALEASNLHRQTLYRSDQPGQPKADLAAAALRRLNPDVAVTAIARKIDAAELLEQIAKHDLALECTDDIAAKLQTSDAAVLLRKPAIFASAIGRAGQLQTYGGGAHSACLRCLWPQIPGGAQTCDQAGVLGSVPALIGSLQAHEALQWLLRRQDFPCKNLENRVLYYDAATFQQRLIRLPIAADCTAHRPTWNRAAYLRRHQSLEYRGTFAEAIAAGFQIIDLRDPAIAAQNPLPAPCQHQSPDQLLNAPPEKTNKKTLLVCHRGHTSRRLAAQLRERGWNTVHSKTGGAQSR
ncbi:MAG: HesA/MoeB/ThiF family protein [Cellvibrionales bacterium]|nr:HesA/MoeB/ThiF family protein [Cellvibrionales bacterium]